MTTVLLDTHVWAWTMQGRTRLSPAAVAAIEGADRVMLSAASLYEIGQKVRLGKWPQMAPLVGALHDLLDRQGVAIAKLDGATCLNAGTLPWDHRDPFDRLIAATALSLDVQLVSADVAFDGIARRIW